MTDGKTVLCTNENISCGFVIRQSVYGSGDVYIDSDNQKNSPISAGEFFLIRHSGIRILFA